MASDINAKQLLDWILIIDQKINIATEHLSSIIESGVNHKDNTTKVYRDEDILSMFKISKRTLVKWRKQRLISFTQVEDTIVYSEEDIKEFLKKYKIN